MAAKKRKRDYVKVGAVKIPWTRFGDGRTCLDLRKWRTQNARLAFTDHAAALAKAHALAIELNAGGLSSQTLTDEDRALYAQARNTAAEFGADVPTVIAEWREARRLIGLEPDGKRPSLAAAIAAGLEALRRPAHLTGDIMLELLMTKQNLDRRHARDLTFYLQHFCKAHPGDIAEISPKQIETWRDSLRKRNGGPLSDCRRNHAHDAITQLFLFARKREYLPDKITAAQKVAPIEIDGGAVDIFTPAEMTAILETVEEAWLPFFAIVAFSGVRVEEACKSYHAAKRKDWLRWEDFDWGEREIVIRANVSKTRQHRRIPLFDNLWEYLAPWRDRDAKGYVVNGSVDRFRQRFKRQLLCRRLDEAASLAGIERKEFLRLPAPEQAPHLGRCSVTAQLVAKWGNQLRHSYGTYRMAQLKRNKHQVAAEMGNSPHIVEKHYDQRVPASHGDTWFQLFPSRPNNVVQLHLALVRAGGR